jgi:hypothetical protein
MRLLLGGVSLSLLVRRAGSAVPLDHLMTGSLSIGSKGGGEGNVHSCALAPAPPAANANAADVGPMCL